MDISKNSDKLKTLWEKKKWSKYFQLAIKNLENSKNINDQHEIDITFRLMRGAIYLMGYEFGESERINEIKTQEINKCVACSKTEEDKKLVGFASGFICIDCSNLISQAFKNA